MPSNIFYTAKQKETQQKWINTITISLSLAAEYELQLQYTLIYDQIKRTHKITVNFFLKYIWVWTYYEKIQICDWT